jgi:hypothetical protein
MHLWHVAETCHGTLHQSDTKAAHATAGYLQTGLGYVHSGIMNAHTHEPDAHTDQPTGSIRQSTVNSIDPSAKAVLHTTCVAALNTDIRPEADCCTRRLLWQLRWRSGRTRRVRYTVPRTDCEVP